MGLIAFLKKEVVVEERRTTTVGSQILAVTIIGAVIGVLRYYDIGTFSWEKSSNAQASSNARKQESFGKHMLLKIRELPAYSDTVVSEFQENHEAGIATFNLIGPGNRLYNVRCVKSPREMCLIKQQH